MNQDQRITIAAAVAQGATQAHLASINTDPKAANLNDLARYIVAVTDAVCARLDQQEAKP